MRAADRELHALGIADHGLALGHQFVDQGAQADLVVGIGALERGDLAAHDRLQLAGARHSTLDAVAHGGDFTPDGLAEREHGIGAHHLRLGQPQRDFGHRAGHQAHLLRPAIEGREHEEEDDGGADGERQKRPFADTEGGETVLQAAIDRAEAVAQDKGGAAQPGQRRQACEPVGLGRGTDRKGLNERARIATVVIRDAAGVGRDRGARGRCCGRRRLLGRGRLLDPRQVELEVVLCRGGQFRLGGRIAVRIGLGLVEPESLLDRRHGGFGRILDLLLPVHAVPPRHATKDRSPGQEPVRVRRARTDRLWSGREATLRPSFTNSKGS